MCEPTHSNFTPLVMSDDGIFASQTNSFMETLTTKLAYRWDRANSGFIKNGGFIETF